MRSARGLGWTLLVAVAAFALGLLFLNSSRAKNTGWFRYGAEGLAGRSDAQTQLVMVPGTPERVRKAVWSVTAVENTAPDPVDDMDAWTEVIQAQVWVQPRPSHVVVLPGEGRNPRESRQNLSWALPGAYWAIHSGYPVVFVERDLIHPEAEKMIRRYRVPVYVAAPESQVSQRVMDRIRIWAPAVRIGADDLCRHAAVIAEYRRRYRGVSWLIGPDIQEEWVVAAVSDAGQALAALPMARSHGAGLLFLAADGAVPAAVEAFAQSGNWLERSRRRHRFWLVGAQSRPKTAGLLVEVFSRGRPGSGRQIRDWLEAALCVLFGLSLMGGAGMAASRWKAPLPERFGWMLAALFAPVAGPWLWSRRRPFQGAAQFGFTALLVLVMAYALSAPAAENGLRVRNWEFLLADGLSLTLAAVWSSLLLALGLRAAGNRKRAAVLRTLRSLAFSALAVGLGMLTLGAGVQWLQPPLLLSQNSLIRLGAWWASGVLGFMMIWAVSHPVRGLRVRQWHDDATQRAEAFVLAAKVENGK